MSLVKDIVKIVLKLTVVLIFIIATLNQAPKVNVLRVNLSKVLYIMCIKP